jgi:beta-galactosidase/beta-glucuronidase
LVDSWQAVESPLFERAASHPRPRFTRARWTDLNGPWGFAFDDGDVGLAEDWPRSAAPFTRTITVPFPPEAKASGIGKREYHPIVWYRRTFRLGEKEKIERLLLHFGAVDYRARVWVNGQRVVSHEGGQTPFTADITPALRPHAAEQVIVVRVEDWPHDLTQPRGKQFWEPESRGIWHARTTGIWQPVWLEPVGATHIEDIRWTPDADQGTLGLQVALNMPPDDPLRLRVRLRLRDMILADDEYTVDQGGFSCDITVARGPQAAPANRRDLLWAPDHPNLIEAELTLLGNGRTIDEVWSYAGLRSVSVAGGRFLLNGRPFYLRMVLEQGYWEETHLAAPSVEALRREVELTKELGFNGARVHQKVEDPRYLYWCDRLGLLVWGEMANAFVYSHLAVERLTREWLDVVRRDYSHPCIVAWVPINESWGVPALRRDPAQRHYIQALYHLTRALDTTRPVIGNDGWEHLTADIWGLHDYSSEPDGIRERYGSPEAIERTLSGDTPAPGYHVFALPGAERGEAPVMITEFGGMGFVPNPGERWFGYGTVRTAEAYLARYGELVRAILDCPNIVGFCYTQLTDTAQETNGLLTADRRHKLDPAAVRAITTGTSRALPVEGLNRVQQQVEAQATGGTR